MNRTFNKVKVQLLTHSFQDWSATYGETIPLRGEVCICTLTDIESSHLGTAANVLVKIGDGIHPYKELQYIGAYAIDCGLWCKKDNPEFIDFNQGQFKEDADQYLNAFILNILNNYATKDWVENIQLQVDEKQDEITLTNKLPYEYISGTPDIESYSKIADTAHNIGLEMDQNYKIVAKLYDINNVKLSESEPIDIPLESVVLSVHYDEDDNSIVITMRDGTTTIIPVTQLTRGLVNQEELERDYTPSSKLARVATTGDYELLNNEPHDVSYFNNDAGYLTEHQDISGKQDVLTPGTNIDITDNVISVTGQLWELGEGANSIQTVNTGCRADGDNSVAEGELTSTVKDSAMEEGWRDAKAAHAEGGGTLAGGNYSHAEGNGTVTNNPYEHAEGHFNMSHYQRAVYPSAGNTIHSIGIGSNIQNKKNAVEVMQNGDMYVLGIGDYDGLDYSSASTLQSVISEKQGKLDPSYGISIMDTYISVDSTVMASRDFVNEELSVIDEAKQDKLTASTGIDIDAENNISCTLNSMPEIPDDAEDGTYVLKAVVSSGSVIYSWVKE